MRPAIRAPYVGHEQIAAPCAHKFPSATRPRFKPQQPKKNGRPTGIDINSVCNGRVPNLDGPVPQDFLKVRERDGARLVPVLLRLKLLALPPLFFSGDDDVGAGAESSSAPKPRSRSDADSERADRERLLLRSCADPVFRSYAENPRAYFLHICGSG